jgi:hypothetical protein
MRRHVLISALMILGAVGCSSAVGQSSQRVQAVDAQEATNEFTAHLSGFQEVAPTCAVSTASAPCAGSGDFHATLNAAENELTFDITWSNLTGPAAAAHVHFGQFGVNGGVSFFFCGGGGKPPCAGGHASGTVTAANVVGPTTQGIAVGELNKIIAAMRAGVAYANIHTATFPGGEIRGQINFGANNTDQGERGDD